MFELTASRSFEQPGRVVWENLQDMSGYVDGPPADGRIVELAKQTTSRLEILWDEVGYTPEEKRRQMQGLIDGFQTLCENKVKHALLLCR